MRYLGSLVTWYKALCLRLAKLVKAGGKIFGKYIGSIPILSREIWVARNLLK
jgi:hypothetical protein